MRVVAGIVTLAFVGVIVADIVAHPDAFKAGITGLQSIFSTAIGGMLGQAPAK
jgi:hypothetical protein